LGGEIELVSSQGKGCCFTIYIPIQQSLVDVQIIRTNEQTMALPLINLLDSYAMESNRLVWQRGKQWFITDDNRQVPLIDICKFLPLPANKTENESAFILLLNAENTLFAVLVDGLAEQTQLLIKSLRTHYRHIDGIKGIAVLPEGNLALLLDPSKLFESFQLLGDNKNDG
jgi:two-component system chemotaxis sensor kinase CheA